jgi:N-acetylneuraminic acid mutarotase
MNMFLLAITLAVPPALPPLPQAVSSFGAAVNGNHLYVYGGHAGRTHNYSTETTSNLLRRLDLANPNTGWETLPGGPSCQGVALVSYKNALYRIGGMRPRNAPGENADNHSLSSFAKFDIAKQQWEQLADLPAGRSSHDAVVVGDVLYVFGGWTMKGGTEKPSWHDTGLSYDLSKDRGDWQTVSQPFRRRALTAAALNGKVYVVAGLTPEGKTDPTVNIFDPARKEWTTGPAIPAGTMNAFTPAAVVANKTLYLNPADGDVYKLNGSEWTKIGAIAHPRFVHRVVAWNGTLLAVGGASKAGNVAILDAVETKTPGTAISDGSSNR